MASIEKRVRDGRVRWYTRYRDPEGKQRTRTFDRKVDAERFLTTTEASKLVGGYVDPRQAARTFREVAEEHWAATSHNLAEDTTRPTKRARLDRHILPVLGSMPVGAIKPSTVAAAVATWTAKPLAAGTVGQILRQVRQILDAALSDGIVTKNVAKDRAVKVPTPPRRRNVHLTDVEVTSIIEAAPDWARPLVVTLAGLGLRISEAAGLLVVDVDFLRRTVRVRQQLRASGKLGVLKTESSWRDIPASDVVLEALAEQIRLRPRDDGRVFSSMTGGTLTKAVGGHLFDDLSTAAGVDASPHSFRHYFGSSLISRGVSVVAVSAWLGHHSPAITWTTYSYLMPNDETVGRTAMADVMNALRPRVYPMCTEESSNGL